MTEERDPLLQTLFAEAQEDLDGDVFTASVVAKSRRHRYFMLSRWLGLGLFLLLIASLFSMPLAQLGILVSQGLGTELIDLGDTLASWLLAPINNVAGILVLCLKGARMAWKRVRCASYAN